MPTTQYRVCLTKNHQFQILKPLHQHLVLDFTQINTPIPVMTQLFPKKKKSQLIALVLGSKSNHWNHSLLLKKSFPFFILLAQFFFSLLLGPTTTFSGKAAFLLGGIEASTAQRRARSQTPDCERRGGRMGWGGGGGGRKEATWWIQGGHCFCFAAAGIPLGMLLFSPFLYPLDLQDWIFGFSFLLRLLVYWSLFVGAWKIRFFLWFLVVFMWFVSAGEELFGVDGVVVVWFGWWDKRRAVGAKPKECLCGIWSCDEFPSPRFLALFFLMIWLDCLVRGSYDLVSSWCSSSVTSLFAISSRSLWNFDSGLFFCFGILPGFTGHRWENSVFVCIGGWEFCVIRG